MLRFSKLVRFKGRSGDDIAEVGTYGDGLLAVLADGATGCGYGELAARAFVDRLIRLPVGAMGRPGVLEGEFCAADREIALMDEPCDTTGIVASVCGNIIEGASAGDSEAWLLPGPGRTPNKLTFAQRRKPRIGAGAYPVRFGPVDLGGGLLLLASDGLFGWLATEEIVRLAWSVEHDALADALLAATCAASGGKLGDDFSVILIWDRSLQR